jgi:hypothetical protein
MVVALLVGIKLAAELQDEKRTGRSQRTPCGSPQPPEWVNGDDE